MTPFSAGADRLPSTLENLVREPGLIPDEDLHATLGLMEILKARLLERAGGTRRKPEEAAAEDRLVDVREAARMLAMKVHSLYRGAAAGRYPFVVRLGPRQVRFSTAGIQAFLRRRQKEGP